MANACASVLAATKVTPCIPASIMRFTALEPPPPMPITTIFGVEGEDELELD